MCLRKLPRNFNDAQLPTTIRPKLAPGVEVILRKPWAGPGIVHPLQKRTADGVHPLLVRRGAVAKVQHRDWRLDVGASNSALMDPAAALDGSATAADPMHLPLVRRLRLLRRAKLQQGHHAAAGPITVKPLLLVLRCNFLKISACSTKICSECCDPCAPGLCRPFAARPNSCNLPATNLAHTVRQQACLAAIFVGSLFADAACSAGGCPLRSYKLSVRLYSINRPWSISLARAAAGPLHWQ